tara:strand:+ start:622 stop:987 length:366 start_codon:yes stop_codon:yes gene_type:complete
MEVSFCKDCDNMLYLYADEETSELHHVCKSCGYKGIIEQSSKFIYNNNNGTTFDKSEIIKSNPYITHDVTLPKILKNKNIKCNNELCDTEETDITYIKYDTTNMRYIYICNHCGAKWKNNI